MTTAAPSSSPKTSISSKSTTTVTVNKPNVLVQTTATAAQQHQKLQMQSTTVAAEQQMNNNKLQPSNRSMDYSMSGSDTDVSTSNENLSMEQRYVLRHTPRVEPQGQENLAEAAASGNESTGDFAIRIWHFIIA